VNELAEAQCVDVKGEDENDLEAGNLGKIAAFYGIKWETMEMLSQEFGEKKGESKRLKDLIRILASSHEFEEIPIRLGEEQLLKSL